MAYFIILAADGCKIFGLLEQAWILSCNHEQREHLEVTRNAHSVASQYSFSLTTFSPSGKLVQIEYALNAVAAGTTSLGIKVSHHGLRLTCCNVVSVRSPLHVPITGDAVCQTACHTLNLYFCLIMLSVSGAESLV